MRQIAELTPNFKKLCLLSSFQIVFIAAAIIGFAIFLDKMVGFKDLFETFQELGAPPMAFSPILNWLIIGVIAITVLILILNYLALGKVRYVLYDDRLICYNNFLIMQISEFQIPYTNIISVSVDKINAVNNGDIKIDLTGMKKKSTLLRFIDNANQVAAGIQTIINTYRANYYAQYAQEYRLQSIADGNY